MKRLAFSSLAVAVATSAQAAVFTSTATFDWTDAGFAELSLPKYAGPDPIRSVRLTFGGETSRYFDVFAGDDPIHLPALPASWTIALAGPAVDTGGGSSFAPLGARTVHTAFPAIDLPPDPGLTVTRVTPIVTFAFSMTDPNLGLYAGQGDNLFIATSGTDTWTRFRGVVTQTISTGVPEPSTWAFMIAGFGAAGAGLRLRRRARPLRAG